MDVIKVYNSETSSQLLYSKCQKLEYLLIEITFLCILQCPDSACKQDLLAYLQRIALYCHQLNICSKVKAEVQNLGGELIVSGVSWDLGFTVQVCILVLPRQASLATVLLKTPNYSDSQEGFFFFFLINVIIFTPDLTITHKVQFDFPIIPCLYQPCKISILHKKNNFLVWKLIAKL